MSAPEGLRIKRFDNRATALGLAVNYLMNKPAFARLPFGHWSRILAGQIRRGHYFFVCTEKGVVGFAGWALGSEAEAEAWASGSPSAQAMEGTTGDCIVLNAWAAESNDINRFLLNEMRRVGRGKAALFAKREYPDGRKRLLRLNANEIAEKHIEDAERAAREPATA
jgi:hemolysin-activating ACP:hemolysin acyltransferase